MKTLIEILKSAFEANKFAVLSDVMALKFPSNNLPIYAEINFK